MAVDTHDPHVGARGAEPARPVAGLFQSLNHFLATFVTIVHTRLELLTTELQEEVRQVGGILLWAFVAAFAVMMSLFLAALAVIFVFWDTHRVVASVAMVGLFVVVAVVAGLILRHKLSTKPPLLDDTLAELGRDRDQLKARL
jgi:uncharacterized membrane protein YqjE